MGHYVDEFVVQRRLRPTPAVDTGIRRYEGFACSERRRADDLPAMPFSNRAKLLLVHRVYRSFYHLLEQLSGPSGGVHEQHAACLGAGALPGMRYIARHEGAGAWPADCDCVADLEGDLAAQDVSDLVAVVMEMRRGHGADRCHLLEYHYALVGLAVPQLEGGRAAGGHLPRRPLPGHYDQAVCMHHCLSALPGFTT